MEEINNMEERKIKNVLSIDIDVFFECNEYAEYMFHQLDEDLAWNVISLISQEKNISLKPNVRALQKVCDLLHSKYKKGVIVEYIEEHDEIVKIMEKHKVKDCNMYNIDFHHDISYGEEDNELNLENWVRHSKSRGQILNYNWLHRELSELNCDSPFFYTRTCLGDLDVNKVEDIDLIVICTSHHFTPKKYQEIIKNILSEELKKLEEMN